MNVNDSERIRPYISVIIPIYNMSTYLPQCLDSVIGQKLRNIEIICVDDGSNDNSLDILKAYQVRDSRIHILTQKNQGSGPARNVGIIFSKGEYVAFMDPDDWYPEDDILDVLYKNAKKYNVMVCGGSLSEWDGNEQITEFSVYLQEATFSHNGIISYSDYQGLLFYIRFIYNGDWLKAENIVFPSYNRGQDALFFVKAMISAKEFYAVSKIVYCYRVSHKKILWNTDKITDYIYCLTDILELSVTNTLFHLHLYTMSFYCAFCGSFFINRDQIFLNNPNILSMIKRKEELFNLTKLFKNEVNIIDKITFSVISPIFRHLNNETQIHCFLRGVLYQFIVLYAGCKLFGIKYYVKKIMHLISIFSVKK